MRFYIAGIALLLGACSSSIWRPASFYKGLSSRSTYEVRGVGQTAVATQGRFSTDAALEILAKGGNMADAAVAVSFVQAVERPHSTGIGGGGFLLWARQGQGENTVEAWDFRERAPLATYATMFLDPKTGKVDPLRSRYGSKSPALPGLVAGLADFHKAHGKLPWKDVLQPAIRLASEGFDVYRELAEALDGKKEILSKNKAARKIFFKSDQILKEGDRLIQKDLAQTLSLIADQGRDAFYRGIIASKIIQEAKRSGIPFVMADLKNYEVKLRPVIKARVRDFIVYSMPPPSSGGLHIVQILNILEGEDLKKKGALSLETVHLNAAAMQRVFMDRAKYLGDPDFVNVPTETLVSKSYARKLRSEIPNDKAVASDTIKITEFLEVKESDDTIHFSMMDSEGNAVSSTQTINGHFGSGIVVEGTGILLNNEMDDFAAAPGASNLFEATAFSEANMPQPRKTPLSSMSPSIIEKDGRFVAALGSPSGTRIFTCVAQVIQNRFVHGMNPWESVSQIRYHHQWKPDELRVDEPGFPDSLKSDLERMGYKINTKNLGCRVQYVERDPRTGVLTAVSDPRAEGAAAIR
jgi:gamma-glutamyltranspeptidase/glutathione hydrolase